MDKLLRFLSIAILGHFAVLTVASAQSVYHFKNFTISEGLSQSSALCIHQDNNFGLWIGTQDGLNRFDGKSFEIYTAEDTRGFGGNHVPSILSTRLGDMWFGTSNGLVLRNRLTDVFTTYSPKINNFSIEKIAISPDERTIWIATTRHGIWTFDIGSKRFLSKSEIFPSRTTKNIFVSKENVVYVVSDDRKLESYHIKTGKATKLDFTWKKGEAITINTFNQINSHELVLGTSHGVYVTPVQRFAPTPLFPQFDKELQNVNVTGILHTTKGYWYITTSNRGLFTIYPTGKIINSTQDNFQKNALLNNSINAIFEDKNNTIWLATSRGISNFNPVNQGFLGVTVSGDLKHGLPSASVWSITENGNGDDLYIGTDVGVSKYCRQRREFFHYFRNPAVNLDEAQENHDEAVLDIHYVNDQLILAACMDGFFELKIQPNGKYAYHTVDFIDKYVQEKHKKVYKIEHYKAGMYFLATKAGALLVDFDRKLFKEFVHSTKYPSLTISQGVCRLVFKDSKGRMFFATSDGGLSILDDSSFKNLQIIPYQKNEYLSNNRIKSYITSMTEVRQGEYILGTGGDGILHWYENRNHLIVYSKTEGLPNNVVYTTLLDNDNHVWISTNKGLSKFDLATKQFVNFTDVHGLLSNEFNIGAGLNSKSNRMYFGGIAGIVFFDPDELSNQNYNVRVVLTKLKLDNDWVVAGEENSPLQKSIALTNHLELDYTQRSFTIRFQSDDLANNELVTYKYILEGANSTEIEIGHNNELRFNSLAPGSYQLKLYARVGVGDYVSQPTILHIDIAQPFWFAWWFWTIIVGLVYLLIRYIMLKRIEFERREQVRLEMKIAERTLEINNQKSEIEKQKEQLQVKSRQLIIEKEKSERLLRNVIPDTMADELLETGTARARAFKVVSVLFTDFVGFTEKADSMNPTDLVKKLDIFFRKFDEIIIANNLERIKTIGDAYMAAGGVPLRNTTNPIDAVLAGIQIQHYMKGLEQEVTDAGEKPWVLRLGINTGEVTAGVIGTKRLAYDIWGSTVNYAQRMEMFGEPGKVTISFDTYVYVNPYFEGSYVGTVQNAGGGDIKMYQVDRIKPELSIDGLGIYPNERFQQIVNLHHYSSINYYKAERFIMRKLRNELSDKLHYHSINHTRDVLQAVERLALSENVTDEALFLLKTAASYHDAGFIEQYEANEPVGVRMASEILPTYGYTDEHIEIIKDLIFVTAVPHHPNNHLEEIICDADLDYLGREDFHEISDKLRLELREHGKLNSDRQWDEIQVKFFAQHKFFTKTAKKTRDTKKAQNLQEIKDRLARDDYKD